jgi:hypothetical protein
VAPLLLDQFAVKLLDVMLVAAFAVGAAGAFGSVATVIVLELPLVPPVLYARTR